MANQSKTTRAVTSQIDWRTIRLAGGAATFMVLVSMVTVWAAGRSMDSAKRRIPPTSEVSPLLSPASVSEPSLATQMPLAIERPEPSQYPEAIHPAVVLAAESAPAAPAKGQPESTCATSTVSVEFAKDPTEAATLAKQEHKLMFVLHVSGNFEESKFT
jgi:hypothetical protein